MEAEKKIEARKDLNAVLDDIDFGPSGVMLDKMDIQWDIERVYDGVSNVYGWRVRLTFDRPDTVTGVMGRGAGRWEIVEAETTESGVVKTAWVLLKLLVDHELMEAFKYKGKKVFDPHHSIDDLMAAVAHRAERA